MTTDYDPIAEQYQRSKQQPWRTHIGSFTLMELVGDLTDKTVLDVALVKDSTLECCGPRRGQSRRRRPVGGHD